MRPLPRTDDEWTYTSVHTKGSHTHLVEDMAKIIKLVPQTEQIVVADQALDVFTLKYPSFENPIVMANLRELGYTSFYAGIVKGFQDSRPEYESVTTREPRVIYTGIAIVDASLEWLHGYRDYPYLVKLIRIVNSHQGFMLGPKCNSAVHVYDRFNWSRGLPVDTPETKEGVVDFWISKTPVPPELLTSLVVSCGTWTDEWRETTKDAIRRAHDLGIDKAHS